MYLRYNFSQFLHICQDKENKIMNNSVVTRFAPSPTGYLHIGGARTALFNYLFSKANDGKFLLRIEDTDEKRSSETAIDAILQGLEWLGLKHEGDYVLQSKNLVRHAAVAQELLAAGKAYLCYTSAEELEEMRAASEKKGEVFRFKSSWRDKSQSQTSVMKPVIRIKAPLEGEVVIKDLVQGEVRVSCKEIDDLVMLRGDGTPTYMLAVVVDDHDMAITHVIRGDDHFTNAFRQKIIYEAMGWAVPQFAHIPLIHGADGAKMSKRHGATSVIEYQQMGYLPEAMRNYLLRLGWSHGDAEIISDAQATEWFNLEKVGKSPARFDFVKLDHVNKHYLEKKTDDELFDLLFKTKDGAWLVAIENSSEEVKNRIKKAIKFLRVGASRVVSYGHSQDEGKTLDELSARIEPYLDKSSPDFGESKSIIRDKKSILENLLPKLEALQNWNHDEIKNALNNFATEQNLKIKDFGPILRLVLTFSASSGGGIFDVIDVLGQDESIKRIKNALKQIVD